jgi:hypothetical protein
MQRSTQEAIKLPPSIIAGKQKKKKRNEKKMKNSTQCTNKYKGYVASIISPTTRENPGRDPRERKMGQEHGGRNSFPRTSSSVGMMNISLQYHWTARAPLKLIKGRQYRAHFAAFVSPCLEVPGLVSSVEGSAISPGGK